MKHGQQGFTIVEMALVVSITAIIALIAGYITFHIYRTADRASNHLTAISHEENAGYWISRDANMADAVIVDDPSAFLILKWTKWGYGTDNFYYIVTYSIENVSGGIGQLKRRYQEYRDILLVADQQIQVAKYIYYNAADPDNTTRVTYQSFTTNLRVATRSGSNNEVKEYTIWRRSNF